MQNLTFLSYCLFLYSLPFSVTLSQAFAILSFGSFFILSRPKLRDFPLLFYSGICLYFWIYLSGFLNHDLGAMSRIQAITKSEFSDIWMLLLLPLAKGFTNAQKTILRRILGHVAILLIISGCLSLLFPYRLSTYVMDGFQYTAGKRLPHLIQVLPILNISLFLPIGFQNTHLTYGGLLALFLPTLLYQSLRLYHYDRKRQGPKSKILICYLLFTCLGVLLLLFNQSRSIWIGLFLALFLLLNKKRLKSILTIKNGILITLMIIILASISGLLYNSNWLFKRSLDQLFTKQTLENQRVWIHKANFQMIANSYVSGVGSGNYKLSFENVYQKLIDRKPYLFYEIAITPKSHAHHDFLHFIVTGGLLGGCLFLLFWILLLSQLQVHVRNLPFLVGIYAIFISGFFQCFFLDDEILLPLLALAVISKSSPKEIKIINFRKSIIFIFLPLLVSVFYLWNMTQTHEDDLFLHRTRDRNNFLSPIAQKTINGEIQKMETIENEFYFKLEGCLNQQSLSNLTHIKRREPLTFIILTEKPIVGYFFPDSFQIEVRERDSFDQDQKFKAQEEKVILLRGGKFVPGRSRIQIETNDLPETVKLKFWDFGITYHWSEKENKKILPILSITPNCF